MRALTLLALLGLTHAEEAAAEAGPAIPWFWSADAAAAAEQKAKDDNVPNVDGGVVMSAVFALQSCVGFQNDGQDFIYEAREWKCNVKTSQTETGRKDATSALALTGISAICPELLALSTQPRPYDAMPTTFNFPVRGNTLDINGDDFVVTLADGTFTRPVCAILDPAAEPNELHTVALIGHFGGRKEGTWPQAIEVVSDTLKLWDNVQKKQLSAKGLKLERATGGTTWQMGNPQYGHSMSYESGLVMLQSWAFKFTTKGEGANADNNCQLEFPATTHVIKVLFNGGQTKDGIHPLLPSDTSLFTVILKRGKTLLWNKFIGLADLGNGQVWKEYPEIYETDGDNYLDLCLLLGADDNIEDITSVMIQADAVFPPRGTGKNVQHSVKVNHLPNDQYPYNLLPAVETVAEKLFSLYFAQIMEYIAISVLGLTGAITVPLAGVGFSVGVMFLEAFVQNPALAAGSATAEAGH